MAVKHMSPEAYRALSRARAKMFFMRAMMLTPTSFSVPSRNESPGYYYLVVTTKTGAPIGCIMDGESCKAFQYNGYCIHAGAVENSIADRKHRKPRQRKRAIERELTSKARTKLIKRIEELEAMGQSDAILMEVKPIAQPELALTN